MPSAIRPVPHRPGIPVPSPTDTVENFFYSDTESECEIDDELYGSISEEPKRFTQSELNDLVRDLNLPKNSAEVLAGELVYCSDIPGLIANFKVQYKPDEWRLFIDSSKRRLKAVLLHNGHEYTFVPVGHSLHLKECYENLDFILNKLSYLDHKWAVCGDLKVISMLLGQQKEYMKCPCFLCEWDGRDRKQHYIRKEWPIRRTLDPGDKNIQRENLVDPEKVLLPPLHIKLCLMKQFVKALTKERECFKYICDQFPCLSEAKLKAGVFIEQT
ncbi:hypothetical protein AVEN_254870-1 [Araneus ventricosus]|uniref:Uncharacterized protein n=1 Tax=Araneus ventricosus TaxID=182803 RepID=A0A4Y2VBX3_ARAVE|nr:hypothetical protein AVEN_254870-1 [Araneus ventricosus]